MFNIREYVSFDDHGRAVCPSCSQQGKSRRKNLSLVPDSTGNLTDAYKCHRGCTVRDIRDALGAPKTRQTPAASTRVKPPAATLSPAKVKQQCARLLATDGPAMAWLTGRGITPAMVERYQLGICRCKVGQSQKWAIAIPIPNADATAYYCKKRVCPWDKTAREMPDYQPWKQYGIPQTVFFTHRPDEATETWLCEGEWDAIRLGWLMADQKEIAVACFTCGAGNVPPTSELDRLPGQITIWYDRNDKPLKNGDRPGEVGARRAAEKLGDRARIAIVPMPEDCTVHGWDVSNALDAGYGLNEFLSAADQATRPRRDNPLRKRLLTNDELIARAPDYVEWLVPDLLTQNELFAVAAPPRGGKSLLALTLAKCVATGEKFLDRPVTKGSVIYVNLEDSDAKIKEREEAQGWKPGLSIYWLNKFKLDELPYLVELIEEIGPRLVILDTLSRVRNDGVAEASAEMSIVLEPLQETAKEYGCCILLIHHTKKIDVNNEGMVEVFDTIRGSGAIRATCRGCLVIAPADDCYRLVAENGHGKHDLRIRLDVNTLEWKLLGRWAPTINMDQRQIALDYLNKVGSATIDQIAHETQLPKRSLYTVLARLVADDLLIKTGTRQSAIYSRPIQQIQLLNSVLNPENPDEESNTSAIQQKNSFSLLDRGDLGQIAPGSPLTPENRQSVELKDREVSNVDAKSNPAIQQQFNSDSTVELNSPKSGLGVMQGGGDPGVIQTVTGVICEGVSESDPPGLDPVALPIQPGDIVEIIPGRFGGSICEVLSVASDGRLEVKRDSWTITRVYEPSELKLISPALYPGDVIGFEGQTAIVERVTPVFAYVVPNDDAREVGWKRSAVELLHRVARIDETPHGEIVRGVNDGA